MKYAQSSKVKSVIFIENSEPSNEDVTDQSAPPIGALVLFNAPDSTRKSTDTGVYPEYSSNVFVFVATSFKFSDAIMRFCLSLID